MAEDEQTATGTGSTALKAAVAAAATGAAAYGIRRVRAAHDAQPEHDGSANEADNDGDAAGDGGGLKSMREDLTQTLSSKVVGAKQAASKLKPGSTNATVLEAARGSAVAYVLPIAKDAASSLGAAVARKAPEVVRDELMPRFIEGFEKEA